VLRLLCKETGNSITLSRKPVVAILALRENRAARLPQASMLTMASKYPAAKGKACASA